MDTEKPHGDYFLSSTKRVEINVATKPPSRDAVMNTDWTKLVADLERLLKLRSIPFGMKLFERREEMEAIPRIRRPKAVHTLDQIVAQAARLGWTVGLTSEDLVGAQCRAVVGLGLAKDDKWRSGEHMMGVWYSTPDDAAPIRQRWSAYPTAATRLSRWLRSPAAGSIPRTSRCFMQRRVR
jgi:hypothetical protein